MEQDSDQCIVSTRGYIEVFLNSDGAEETVVYGTPEELAEGLGVDVADLQVGGTGCAGYCIIRKTWKKNGDITITCQDKCVLPCVCHVIKMTKGANGKIVETDMGTGPRTYTPAKGTAYTCRCV